MTLTTSEQWKQLVVLMGRPEWADELPTIRERAQHGAEIDDAFAAWSARCRRPRSSGCCWRSVFPRRSCASRSRRATTSSSRTAVCSSRCTIPTRRSRAASSGRGLPIAFDGRAEHLPPAELLGTSTDAVLTDWLGLDPAELARLRAAGVIASADR